VTFLERADNAILVVAADILGLFETSLPRNTRFEMSLPIRFGGIGVGELVSLADAAHVGAAGLAVGFAVRVLIAQDARVRGDTHADVPIEPTMYGRLAPLWPHRCTGSLTRRTETTAATNPCGC
jgi:hypothetical protein